MKTCRSAAIVAAVVATFAGVSSSAFYPQWVESSRAPDRNVHQIFTADFNRDGRPDIVGRNAQNELVIWLARADGSPDQPMVAYTGDYLSSLQIGDADADGRIDLIAADIATNSLIVIGSNGDGTFRPPIATQVPIAPTAITVGDFTGDGKLDVVARSYSALALAIFQGDGVGQFAEVFRVPVGEDVYRLVSGDIDGDGKQDVFVAQSNPFAYHVYFGSGTGTLVGPVSMNAPTRHADQVRLADLDHDGDLEIISCEFSLDTVTVTRNEGARTFATWVAYPAIPQERSRYGNPVDLVVDDFSDDGHPDVLVTLANDHSLGTLPGNGDGTLGSPTRAATPRDDYGYSFPHQLAVADFTGDGRPDAVLTSGIHSVVVMANAAGESSMTITTPHRTISAGQSTAFGLTILPKSGYEYYSSTPPVAPAQQGTITFRSGETIIGTGVINDHFTSITVPSLPVGRNEITASFDGDSQYRAAVSPPIIVNVVEEVTTTQVTIVPDTAAISYGDAITIFARVTSPIAKPLNGFLHLYMDGVRWDQYSYATGPNAEWTIRALSLGTHTFRVEFEGTDSQPPSKSELLTRTIVKGTTRTEFVFSPSIGRSGAVTSMQVRVEGGANRTAMDGDVTVYEGMTALASFTVRGGYGSFNLPSLPAGVHYLRAVYAGNANWEGSESAPHRFVVAPAQGFFVEAAADSQGRINVQGVCDCPSFITRFVIYRKIGTASWTKISDSGYSPIFQETAPAPNTLYSYRMEAHASDGTILAWSNADSAMVVSLTDDPLRSGMAVKAVHLRQVVDVMNSLRAAAGLAPVTFMDIQAGEIVLAGHVTELRAALDQTRAAYGVTPFSFGGPIASGSVITMKSVQDLREALR